MISRRGALLGAGLGTLSPTKGNAMPANTHLRATVQAPGSSGDPFSVIVDGADSAITVNGKPGYAPVAGDRIMLTRLGTQVQMVSRLAGVEVITAAVFQSDDNVGLASAGGVQGFILSSDTAGGLFQGFTGAAAETGPCIINPDTDGVVPVLFLKSPLQTGFNRSVLELFPGGITISGTGSGGVEIVSGNLLLDTGDVDAFNGTGTFKQLTVTAAGSTTSAANARINGSGNLLISTSLSAHKLKQKALGLDKARRVLKVEPTTWFDKFEVEENDGKTEGLRRVTGAIGEQVAQVAPEFAEYDSDGNLSGVDYRGMAVALLTVVQDQQKRIEALESR